MFLKNPCRTLQVQEQKQPTKNLDADILTQGAKLCRIGWANLSWPWPETLLATYPRESSSWSAPTLLSGTSVRLFNWQVSLAILVVAIVLVIPLSYSLVLSNRSSTPGGKFNFNSKSNPILNPPPAPKPPLPALNLSYSRSRSPGDANAPAHVLRAQHPPPALPHPELPIPPRALVCASSRGHARAQRRGCRAVPPDRHWHRHSWRAVRVWSHRYGLGLLPRLLAARER